MGLGGRLRVLDFGSRYRQRVEEERAGRRRCLSSEQEAALGFEMAGLQSGRPPVD
jgi:hypothetical protein